MQPVILDMDPGVDDALAIILALNSPELDVIGVTTVSGNVPVKLATENALKVLELVGRSDIPVFEGASRPLVREPVYAHEFHGRSGLGEAELPAPRCGSRGDGIDFMIETLERRAGEVTLIATGPLTNLALAHGRSPGVLRAAREIVVMGGTLREPGNVTPTAEYNFYVDPQATRAVVGSGAATTLVGLDATRQVMLTSELMRQQLTTNPTATAAFCEAACRPAMAMGRGLTGHEGIHLHDPLAVAVAIDREICRFESVQIDVETEGELTAGQIVADFRQYVTLERRTGIGVSCAVSTDRKRFMQLFLDRVFG